MSVLTENGYLTKPETSRLCEKWAKRINLVESALNEGQAMPLEKKAALAKILENTQSFLKYQLQEATQSGDIGQYKRFALDIVTAVIPNLIAYDIVSVQPISNRHGMVNYIKYIYGSTKGKTAAGTSFADALNMHASDPNYTSNVVEDEQLPKATAAAVTGNTAWSPVLPGSFELTIGNVVIKDDGQGNLTASAGLVAGATIDYATGAYSFTLSTADTTSQPVASYKYNNEYIPANDIPEIQLKIESVSVYAEARRLKAFYSFEAAYELNKEYGTDIQKQLNAQAAAEIAHEIDIEICNDLYKKASAGAELTWSKNVPVGVSKRDHYDSFTITLEEGSAKIHQATRRVAANFIVCGTQVGVVISSCVGFESAGTKDITGPYFLGTLKGRKVFVNPEMDPNAFLEGFKGENLLNAGYVYAPYMPILTTDVIQLEDMAGRRGWCTMYGKVMLNSKMYIRGKITA